MAEWNHILFERHSLFDYVFFYKHIKIQGLGSDMCKATENIG